MNISSRLRNPQDTKFDFGQVSVVNANSEIIFIDPKVFDRESSLRPSENKIVHIFSSDVHVIIMEWKKDNKTYQILKAAEDGGYGVLAPIAYVVV